MGALAPWHWVVLIIVIVLVFGGSLLPRLGRFFGRSVSGLKQGLKESTEEFKTAVKDDSQGDKLDTTGSGGSGGPNKES